MRWEGPFIFEVVSGPQSVTVHELTPERILSEPWESYGNYWETGYPSFQSYRDMHMILAREDFLVPVRNALKALQRHQLDTQDLHIYSGVHITFVDNSAQDISDRADLYLKFDLDYERSLANGRRKNEKMDWSNSNRLEHRNLLILSQSSTCRSIDALCEVCQCEREFLQRGIVPVSVIYGEIKLGTKYFMYEPPSNWSGHNATLKSLSGMTERTFSEALLPTFLRGKVDSTSISNPLKETVPLHVLVLPGYKETVLRKLGAFVGGYQGYRWEPDMLLESPWYKWALDKLNNVDKDTLLRVDHEQYQAIKHAISNPVTLVNGAPGTGKTHLTREYVRLLLNMNLGSPVVVCTYTNHSLDAFLEGIVDILQDGTFVRCGGPPRTHNERILKHVLSPGMYRDSASSSAHYRWRDGQKMLQKMANFAGMVSKIEIMLTTSCLTDHILVSISKMLNKIFGSSAVLRKMFPIFTQQQKTRYSRVRNDLPRDDDYFFFWVRGPEYYRAKKEEYQSKFRKFVGARYSNQQGNSGQTIFVSSSGIRSLTTGDIARAIEAGFRSVSGSSSVPTQLETLLCAKLEQQIQKGGNPILNLASFIGIAKYYIMASHLSLMASQKIKLKEKEALEELALGKYLRKMKVVAITSTVASVHREALAMSRCKVFIIEEAGELTESMVAGTLPSTVEHLMLVGDYNQLRPKVEYKLTFEPYCYDISAFERFVRLAKTQRSSSLFSLSIQRRMHPDISRLLRAVFYDGTDENITDGPGTSDRGRANSMPLRVQFIFHRFPETMASGRSHANREEARMAAALVIFFIARGYDPSDITVMPLYKGQKHVVKEELAKLEMTLPKTPVDPFKGVKAETIKVKVVDDYQGEESKVVIVCLTRDNSPGFVKNRNRALVTLSRGRDYLIVLGHGRVFGMNSRVSLWKKISKTAVAMGYADESNPGLRVHSCPVHNPYGSNKGVLRTADDILQYRFNFCDHKCNRKLPCGHSGVCISASMGIDAQVHVVNVRNMATHCAEFKLRIGVHAVMRVLANAIGVYSNVDTAVREYVASAKGKVVMVSAQNIVKLFFLVDTDAEECVVRVQNTVTNHVQKSARSSSHVGTRADLHAVTSRVVATSMPLVGI